MSKSEKRACLWLISSCALALSSCDSPSGSPTDATVRADEGAQGQEDAGAGSPDGMLGSDWQGAGSCTKAKLIQLTQGKGSVTGEISKTDTDNDLQIPKEGCVGKTTDGPDRPYGVYLLAGKKYLFIVTPDFGAGESLFDFNPALYLLTDCVTPESSCVAGADSALSGVPEALLYEPRASGVYYVVIDSRFKAGASYAFGKYTLTVEEYAGAKPANDSCAGAEALAFVNGSAIKKWHTYGAANDLDLPGTSCTGNPTSAADLFYKVQLTAGNTYELRLESNYAFNEALYLFTDCNNAAGSCQTGMGADAELSGFEMLTFKAPTTGTYYIGVDGRSAADAGSFALRIDEGAQPKNNTCANAQKLTLSGGKVTVNADTTYATSTFSMTDKSCLGETSGGPDLFYQVDLVGGKHYLVSVVPEVAYDTCLYVFTGCSTPESTCLAGKDASGKGKPDKLIFSPSSTGSYYLGVDSWYEPTDDAAQGSLTLSVEEITPPANTTCAAATPVALTAGKATVSGDTALSANQFGTSVTCGLGSNLVAPQLYYSVEIPAGKTLKLTIAPHYHAYTYVFSSNANCQADAINASCGSGGTTGMKLPSIMSGKTGTAAFSPTAGGTYIIAVDGPSASEAGPFTMTLELQ